MQSIVLKLFLVLAFCHADMLASVKLSKKELKKDKDLVAVAAKLQSSPLVTMQLKKTVYNAITDDEKKYDGDLSVTKGSLRLNIVSPDKTMVLVKKSQLWIVNYDSENRDKANQVIHVKSGKEKAHQLLLALLDGDELLEKFSLVKAFRNIKADQLIFELKPKDNIDEIAKVQLTADDKNHLVANITYWDAQENKTQFDFSKIEFLKQNDPDLFSFKPPKGVKVEEL